MDGTLKTLLDNYKIIPLCSNDKRPYAGISYRSDKLTDLELKKHSSIIQKNIGKGINYGLLTGEINDICVVDFDYKDPELKDVATAKKLFNDWCDLLGEKAVVVKSHSGGHHLYFKYKPLMNRSNSIKDLPNIPIDVRANGGYIVAPPSKRNGKSYELIKGDFNNIPDMPDEIFKCLIETNTENIKKSKVERISKNMTLLSEIEISEQEYKNATENLPYFEKLINALPEYYNDNYSDWIRIMIIGSNLYHSSQDKQYVKKVMTDWCKKSSKFKGNEVDEWIEKTNHHSSNKLSINSLWDIIKKENEKVFKQIQQEKYIKLFEGFENLKHTFNPKEFETISKSDKYSYDICKTYFETYFCFVQSDKSVWTLKPEKSSFCSLSKLKEDFSNLTFQTIKIVEQKDSDEVKEEIIKMRFVDKWINDIDRKQYYDAMVCFKNCPPNVLNLFDGFYVDNLEKQGIKPNMENGKKLYDFILKTLFRENPKQGEYVLKWISQMFQQPKNPTNTCLFIYGDKGCGKSTLFQLISALTDGGDSIRAVNKNTENKYVYSTAKMRDLFDKFNSKTEDKLCLCLEEAELGNKTGDSKQYAQTIKDAITNRFVNVEKKYKDIKTKYSFSRYIFISNMDTAVHIEDGDRRFVLGECSNDYSQNSDKYTKQEKLDFWNSIYNDLIGNDETLLGFYKLLLEEEININWEHERPNGKLYEKNQRKNKDVFIKYFTTLNIQDRNIKTIGNEKYVKYEQNHLISKIKKYYKDKGLKFNKNDFDEEYNKIKNKITKNDEPILFKKQNHKSQKAVKDIFIFWKYDDLNEWLKINNYTPNNEDNDNDKFDKKFLDELFSDEEDDDDL